MSDSHAADEQSVEQLDTAWNEAYEENDRSRLQEILADDFEGALADFGTVTKSMLMQPTPPPKEISFSERSLTLFGSTATTRGRLKLTHESGYVDQRFIRVYSKRGARWQAVAVQVFPVVARD